MDHAIYTAMGAASQTLNQQAVTASNLANASTPGFRAQLNALRAVPVEGLSLPTRTLVTASTPGADMTPGQMDYTSRPLDVALQQDGWLAVQTANGSEGYTRNGSIQVDPTGQLTIQGHPVIGEAGPIAVPEGSEITIAADGTISALNPGDPANTIAPVGRLKLVKAGERSAAWRRRDVPSDRCCTGNPWPGAAGRSDHSRDVGSAGGEQRQCGVSDERHDCQRPPF